MKQLYPRICLLLIMPLWISCQGPKAQIQANTWVLFEHVYINTSQQEYIKDTFTLSERKLVLSFGDTSVNWVEDNRPMHGEYRVLETGYLHMLGHDFRINRLGERIMVLEKEDEKSLSQYFFAPDDCMCWEEM
ncbi:MAG: hypothetical protein AAF927_04285 [Bacteroidota bacterium]